MINRTLLFLILFIFCTFVNAADLVVYYGPDGSVLPPGQYQKVEVSFKDGKPVMTTTVIMTISGDTPIPPPIPDVTARIKELINSITADPDKAKTSSGLAEAYKQVLALVTAGTVKDAGTLRKLTETLIDVALADPKVMKTATWKPFTDGMKSLTLPMDFAGVVSAYTIAKGLLESGPTPPPPPPPPPIPATIKSAIILYESQQLTPSQNLLLSDIRNDQWLKTKKIQILDQDSKGQKGTTVPQVNAAIQAAKGKQLPILAGIKEDGSIAFADSLPGTKDGIISKLKEYGLE
jgi:hypothetical protein